MRGVFIYIYMMMNRNRPIGGVFKVYDSRHCQMRGVFEYI